MIIGHSRPDTPTRVGLAMTFALAVWAATRVWAVCRAQHGLPMWDEAAHGLAGIEVADAIRRLAPLDFLLAIQRQALWPFVHSLMLAPAFLIGGIGIAPAEATSVILYAGTIVLIYVAGLRLLPGHGPWIGMGAAALALAAPSYRVYGSLAFLEMPGAFLLMVAFVLYARHLQAAPPWRLDAVAAGAAAAALFFCKYNYGVLWIATVAVSELRSLNREGRAVEALWPARSLRWWLRPMPLLLVVGILGIVAIVVTGGTSFQGFGQRISARTPGNLPYALWLIWLLWMVLPRRGQPSRAARAWSWLAPMHRELFGPILFSVAIWFTLPGHMREVLNFAANRDSGVPLWTLQGLLFYPRAFAADYSPVPAVGWAALALALWPPSRYHYVWRVAWLALVIALAATVLHRYRDSRFFFTVCPLIWLCASARVAKILDGLMQRRSFALRRRIGWALGMVMVLVGALAIARHTAWPERRAALRAPADVVHALDAVLEQIDPATVDAVLAERVALPGGRVAFRNAPPRVALLGYANGFSPGLLAWHARLTRPDLAPSRMPRRVPTLEAGASEAALAERVRWLDTHADVVLAALADSGDAEYEKEIAGDRRTLAGLESGADDWRERADARIGRFRIARFERAR